MASKAASTLVKATPAAALQLDQTDNDSTAAAAAATTTTTAQATKTVAEAKHSSSANSRQSKNNSLPSLPSIRPRRGSSDDFGATGSLGSICGSAVGYGESSLELSASGLGPSLGSGIGTSSSHGSTTQNNSNSNNNNNAVKVRISPSGRRPFRKRKASVDFSFPALSIDDNDSYSVSQLLPQHHGLGAAKAPMPAVGTGGSSSMLMLPAPANRNRLYSDLTIPESLVTSLSKEQQKHNQQRDRHNDLQPEQILPSMDALPAMGDDHDLLPPIENDAASVLLLSHPESPISNTNQTSSHSNLSHSTHTLRKDRGMSFASIRSEGHGVDRLDSLGLEASLSAARIRKGSSVTSDKSHKSKENVAEDSVNSNGNNSYDGTLGSQSHRFLMEAFLGDGTESLVLNPSQRERLGSFDAAAEVTGHTSHKKENHTSGSNHNNAASNVQISKEGLARIGGRRNRLESWGGMSDLSIGMKDLKADQNLESLGVGIFSSANDSNNSGSAAGGAAAGSGDKTAALAATIYTSLANDVSAAAAGDGTESISSFFVSDEKVPTKISVNRDRLNSVASIGTDASAVLRFAGMNGDSRHDAEFPSDVHSFVQAAMASVEDQLADLATAVEAVSKDNKGDHKGDHESEISSTASPLIGAASDFGSNRSMDSVTGRPRSSSISSMLQISVDYDAVAAAVDAAEAAAGGLDLSHFTLPSSGACGSSSSSIGSQSLRNRKKRPLPTNRKPPRVIKKKSTTSKKNSATKTPKSRSKKRGAALEPLSSAKKQCVTSAKKMKTPNKLLKTVELKTPMIPKSTLDDRDMEKLRERARAAAGYVPPSASNGSVKASSSLPPKKRSAAPMTPSNPPRPSVVTSGSNFKTPQMSNTATSKYNSTPASAYSAGTPASSSKGQSSQKWESMFDCLLKFIELRKTEGTDGMTDAQKEEWAWDGNVPTTFKTKDGKALGRWVNNQRSAKSKGSLKKEREKRLVDAGLKWSVLASNSWNEMLEELRIYVTDQIKQGKTWDGNGKALILLIFFVRSFVLTNFTHINSTAISLSPGIVPTNYRIKVTRDKAKPFIKDDDEDKNLGRWVNRQRSMFQAGKLRKDRQLSLEKIGLKWSMLATTSWESMFETLCQYVEGKKKGGNEWDGNVPANYRTEDVPPRALGRWINRQRSAYGKNKLKPEYVVKLNEIGLKWSIHERRPTYHQYTRPDAATSSSAKSPDAAKSSAAISPAVVAKKPDVVTNKEKEAKKDEIIVLPDTVGSAKSLPTSTQDAKKVEPLVAAVVAAVVAAQETTTAVPIATAAVTTQPVKEETVPPPTVTTAAQQVEETITKAAETATVQEENKPPLAQPSCDSNEKQAVKTVPTASPANSTAKATVDGNSTTKATVDGENEGEKKAKIEDEA